MAKQARATEKPAESKAEDRFVDLMMDAAQFVSSRGGIEAAKEALQDAGGFIEKAGGVSQAMRALEVLENLKTKIGA